MRKGRHIAKKKQFITKAMQGDYRKENGEKWH